MINQILEECLRFARKKLSRHQEPFKHFSFVIYNNQIVSRGCNRSTRYPLPQTISKGYPKYSKIHAEFDALRGIDQRRYFKGHSSVVKGFEVVNIRLSRNGDLRNAAPCQCCYRLLNLLGCYRVYYTTNAQLIESYDL